MKIGETFIERRVHKRYLAGICTYAVLRHPSNAIGQIIDISMSGLAFSYLSSNGKAIESHSLDILASEGLCLENIPYEVINHFIIPHELPLGGLTMSRHCVKFNSLTDHHETQIQAFIEKHGITGNSIV